MSEEDFITDVATVRRIEADITFPNGQIHYLAHSFSSDSPWDFVWKPASFFAPRMSLVAGYWKQKRAALRDVACQTTSHFYAPTAAVIARDDPFKNLVCRPSQSQCPAKDSLSGNGIIAKILRYSPQTQSFLVRLADCPKELVVPQARVLAEAPGLVADFFIAEERQHPPQLPSPPTIEPWDE
jgi:hypothetical protein